VNRSADDALSCDQVQIVIPDAYPYPGVIPWVPHKDTMLAGDDFAHYLSVGVSALKNIQETVDQRGVIVRKVLDVPCGFGRVTRALRVAYPDAEIYASDIDPEAVAFCSRTFGAVALASRTDFSLLNFGLDFDLIWVGSLITHLPSDATRSFLSFIIRHLAPGGVALVSSHGAYVAGKLRSAAIHAKMLSDFFSSGYGYADYPGADLSLQRYGNSLISREWLTRCIADLGAEVVCYRDHSWDNHHDVVSFKMIERRPNRTLSKLLARIMHEA
jgi:SAM-dependent methyltransferase